MNNLPSTSKSKQNDGFEDDEIFDDSTLLAHFDNSSFIQRSRFSETNLNDSANRSALNVSALCCDEEISGYDKLTGKTWIYPTNYPVRDYQFNVIKAAILKNTLVSLPTGLGKTFIAAVIMYNFYRWYPLGKIVFTAPTRPLVAQQIDACYNIIAIPPNDTIEMTGHMQATTRKQHWQNKRVFFATPQVIYNDMKSGICPCDKVRCLVIDEAHRARGNYAYCQIIQTLDDIGHKIYRVLALSATPGSKVEDVINVVKHLHIAHLELRTENCIDVAPYSHSRKINTVVIQLGLQLSQLRQQYIEILDGYARRLKQMNILPLNLGNLSKGRIVMLYKEYQSKERGARHPQHNYIMKDFTLLIALYHGLELLSQHGSRVFLNFFDEHPEKTWIQTDDKLTALLERLRDDLGINPLSLDRSILPDGTIPELPKDLCFGHPKFNKLKEIMTDHFTKAKHKNQDTKAIVFCEYRESVNLVHCLLLQCRPLIKPQMFVGQGASGKDGKTVVSQKQQMRVMRSFREGQCNVLVATCVAEEGLDVGSVDLIVCFDISTKSPVRLVQRCGRTGRERGGQVFILVTEGREHQTLLECMRQRDGLNKKVLQSKEVENNLYKLNPRMIPHDFTPQCQKMFITVAKKPDPKEKGKEGIEKAKGSKNQKDLRTMLLSRASTSSSGGSSNKDVDSGCLITENEFNELFPEGYCSTTLFAKPREYWAMNSETIKDLATPTTEGTELKLTKWLEWQRTLQKTVNVHHSRDTEILSELLQYSDAKRFEMPPSTQNPCFSSQELHSQPANIFSSPAKSKQPTNFMSPAKLKQPLVLTSPAKAKQPNKKKQKVPVTKPFDKKDGDIRALFSTATKSTKSYTKLINDLGLQNDGSVPTRLISLLVDLTLENTNAPKNCYVCQNICECNLLQSIREEKKVPMVVLESIKEPKFPDINLIDDFDVETIMKCVKNSDEDEHNVNVNNFDLEIDLGTDFAEDHDLGMNDDIKKQDFSVDSDNFDIGDIADIFADDSTPEEAIEKEIKVKDELADFKQSSGFNIIFDESSPEEGILRGNADEVIKRETIFKDEIIVKQNAVKDEPIDLKDSLGFNIVFADDNSPEEAIEKEIKVKDELVDFKHSSGFNIIFDENSPEKGILRGDANEVIKRETIFKDEIIVKQNAVKDEPIDLKDSLGFNIVFAESSPREAAQSAIKEEIIERESIVRNKVVETEVTVKDEEPKTAKETLGFFGLDSIDDIFADDEIDNTPPEPTQKKIKENNNTQNVKINKSPIEYPLSPSILSGRIKPVPTSPILCSQPRKFQLSTKKDRHHSSTPINSCRKQLIKEATNNNNLIATPSVKPETSIRNSLIDTSNNKSMMTITQLVDMINKTDGNASVSKSVSDRVQPVKERSVSPILLTQADKKKTAVKSLEKSIASTSQSIIKDSFIILDSDSDSDSTQIYDPSGLNNTGGKNIALKKTDINPLGGKRKREMDESVITASPYFNKKLKLDNATEKPMSLQEKVLAVMKKNKNVTVKNDSTVLSCVVSQPNFSSQKENKNPQFLEDKNKEDGTEKKDILDMLQMFRRNNKLEVDKSKLKTIFKTPTKSPLGDNKRKLAFEDSDDDFVNDEKNDYTNHIDHKYNDNTYRSTTNHKTRKKKKKGNEFLDMEAELSDDDCHSGDELSDDSVGSIIDFICDDDNVTHHEDIQAVYLKSIKSPVRGGGFKIPELPARFIKEDILSQYVEEDSYEMDSFCVDSNVGLTQALEVSELELAEMRLEQERKAKKKFRRTQDDSPDVTVIKRNKPKRRLIDSDSDEEST